MKKERLDVILVKRGFAVSREKAKAVIMAGGVFVNGQREDKAGSTFEEGVDVKVKGPASEYVSRGGYKLEKAIKRWGIRLEGVVCADVGASTGGFTDCMLQNGAAKVYAIDVGTNQLAWKLRQDERVVVMEKTNVRYIEPEDLGETVGFVSVDVSFISLTKILVPIRALMKEDAAIVCLVKPQFEAGREKVGKRGVVRDEAVHGEVLETITNYAAGIGFHVIGLDHSPIKGPEGNMEYLLYMGKSIRTYEEPFREETVGEAVRRAHEELG